MNPTVTHFKSPGKCLQLNPPLQPQLLTSFSKIHFVNVTCDISGNKWGVMQSPSVSAPGWLPRVFHGSSRKLIRRWGEKKPETATRLDLGVGFSRGKPQWRPGVSGELLWCLCKMYCEVLTTLVDFSFYITGLWALFGSDTEASLHASSVIILNIITLRARK